MLEHIIMAGSGGQGIQFNGQILSRGAVHQGIESVYVPSYGAERRGGPSFCAVVINNGPIYAPLVQHPDVFLAFDQRARNQYGASIHADGVIIANTDLASQPANGEQAKVIQVPASTIANNLRQGGGPMNLVMLGAYLSLGRNVSFESVRELIESRFAKKPEVMHVNLAALSKGAEAISGEQR